VSAWRRIAHTGLADTHRYRAQATALREQAARIRFLEIRAQLLAIAQKYESIADFVERGAVRDRLGGISCAIHGNDASRIAPRDVAT
jgi:hypothetical protein